MKSMLNLPGPGRFPACQGAAVPGSMRLNDAPMVAKGPGGTFDVVSNGVPGPIAGWAGQGWAAWRAGRYVVIGLPAGDEVRPLAVKAWQHF